MNNNFCQECGMELTPDAYCTRCNKSYGIQSFSNVHGSPFMSIPNANPMLNAPIPETNFVPPTRVSNAMPNATSNAMPYVSPYLPNSMAGANQYSQSPAQFVNAQQRPIQAQQMPVQMPVQMPMPINQVPMPMNQAPMPVNQAPMPKNPQRKVAFGWLIFSAMSLLAMVLPFTVEMDMMNGGFAMVFLSFFALLVGLITSAVFFVRAKTLDKLLSGQDLLAYWTYTPAEWRTYTETEFQIAKGEKVPLLILTSVICLVIGGIFAFADPEAGLVVLGVMLGLIALLSLIVFIAPRLRHEKNQNSLGYAYIGSKGVYLNGVFHNWNMLAASVDNVSIEMEAIPLLAITYSFPARTGRQEETVRIPIPQGQFPMAENIVRYFQARV